MNRVRQGLLPLEDLDAPQFEAFVLQFLASGISLAVIEPSQDGGEKTSKAARYQVVSASLYGASGSSGQNGIDIRAVTETGAEWVFQCKHYSSAFNLAKAEAAVAKAEEEYPSAARYFLVISSEPMAAVRAFVDPRPKWQLWGISELSVKFFNEVPRSKQIEILRRVFPQSSASLIARLYPQHDDMLITAEQFFAPWLKEDRLFNHQAKLVGRDDFLQSLHDFVDDPEVQACILSAPGGVGKTRLLRALGESFAEKHSSKKLYFVDPFATPGVGSDILRGASDNELVVVQDDAHRTETLRHDLASTVIEKNGKLIFSTRPQGADELRAWLTRAGLEHRRIKVITLLPLPRNDLVALALETLPANLRTNAEPIVQRAHGSPLIVSVAARLIAAGNFTDYLTSEDFQRAVFDRFEEEGFARVAPPGQMQVVRDTLRLIAVLAPWKQEDVSIDLVASLLGCTPREFQDNFERLRAAGLLVLTREGWRVVPDLFADHLVYRGCYDSQGRLTSFAKELQSKLLAVATSTMLRNLAEAEWQAQLDGKQIESLLDPFWTRIREQFTASDFFARSQLIRDWRRFGVLQPNRSIQLVRLAIALKDAPPPARPFYAGSGLYNHKQVLDELPTLLEPIAVYHTDYRLAALDLLWELHGLFDKTDERAQNDPLNTIGRIAKFQIRHPIETTLAVVEWLATKLQGKEAPIFCDQPSPVLPVILKPIFERDVEDNYSAGRTFHFRTWPLSVANTRKVRARVLEILESLVIPRGEMAVLNALAVLSAAIESIRWKWKSDVGEEIQNEWFPERCAALAIVENILRKTDSPRVVFKLDRMLRHHACWDSHADFKAACNRVREAIPDTPEYRLARVLLSNSYDEFYHDTVHEVDDTHADLRKAESRWEEFTTNVAREFLSTHPTSLQVVVAAESLGSKYQSVGMPAQFSDFFSAIARVNEDLAADCVDLILGKDTSITDYWWTSLFIVRRKFPDARLLGWVRSVLSHDNVVRWRAAHNFLQWSGAGELTSEVLDVVGQWAARLENSVLKEALFPFHWTGFRGKQIDNAVLLNLDLAKFSDENLTLLGNALARIKYSKDGHIPHDFLIRFIHSLVKISRLDGFGEHEFMQYLADHEPRALFEMLLGRVVRAERKETPEYFIPISYRPDYLLTRLVEQPDYQEIALSLFQNLRRSAQENRHSWGQLFQIAVLRVSPIGLELVNRWSNEVTDKDDLYSLIDALKYDGSMHIFTQADLVRRILRAISVIAPQEMDHYTWQLARTAAPEIRGYTNNELDPERGYYREEAAKAAAIYASDAELGPFYRDIVKAEDADAARHRRWAELELTEWN